MNKLIFTFVIILLYSCTGKDTSSAAKTINTPPPTVVKAQTSTTVQRDTTPPRSNYIKDTSRPVKQINTSFPFDIPMTHSNRKNVNSENILAKNGKPTILLFWLTTCYPCRMELNAIKKIYPQWKEEADFNFVVISTDFQKNYENFVGRVEKENWAWDTFHDTHREFRKVLPGALNGLPQTFVFDKNGEIAYHKRKYSSGDEHKLFDVVKELASK